MTYDEFWTEANNSEVRGVSLQLWPETFDLKSYLPQICRTISQMDLWPAYVEISKGKDFERPKSRRWRTPDHASFDGFDTVKGLTVLSGRRGQHQNIAHATRTISFSQKFRHFYIEGPTDFLTVEFALNLFQEHLAILTPSYGFSDISRWGDCYAFHRGQPTSGMSETREKRAEAFDQIRTLDVDHPQSLSRNLLDIYELNFLSPEHLKMPVFGTTLEKWILSGDRGSLAEIKKGVYTWIVPADIRGPIRSAFLKARYLVVPV
jgi:hypothetical protein